MSKKGFTLVELMVTITIIGVLGSIAIPKFADMINKSRFTQSVALLSELYTAQTVYEMETGSFLFTTSNADFVNAFGINPDQESRNFTYTSSSIKNGLDYSLKAEAKKNMGAVLPGDYIRVNKDFDKWYKGAGVIRYAPNFLQSAIVE